MSCSRYYYFTMRLPILVHFVVFYIFSNMVTVESISFTVKAGSRKCFMDGAKNDIPVKGEYSVSKNDRFAVKLTIKDARPSVNDLLYNKDNATEGKFAFTFDFDGVMEICFENEAPVGSGADRLVSLHVLLGFDTKNYNDIATAQKLAPEEAKMMMLSDMSQHLIKSFGWFIVKGDERHITNESTSGRILYLGVFVCILFVALTAGQLLYLHRFFSSKKLI